MKGIKGIFITYLNNSLFGRHSAFLRQSFSKLWIKIEQVNKMWLFQISAVFFIAAVISVEATQTESDELSKGISQFAFDFYEVNEKLLNQKNSFIKIGYLQWHRLWDRRCQSWFFTIFSFILFLAMWKIEAWKCVCITIISGKLFGSTVSSK